MPMTNITVIFVVPLCPPRENIIHHYNSVANNVQKNAVFSEKVHFFLHNPNKSSTFAADSDAGLFARVCK